jgi:hypothetical protein
MRVCSSSLPAISGRKRARKKERKQKRLRRESDATSQAHIAFGIN